MINAETIESTLIPILILVPFTVIDAGMGILFVTLSMRAVDQDALFRGLIFVFGAALLASSLYISVASVNAILHWITSIL